MYLSHYNNDKYVTFKKIFRGNLMKALILTLCLAFCALLTSCSGASDSDASKKDLKVGVLLDANGQKYAIGKSAKIAIELAAEDINNYLQEMGHTKRIKLFFEDTQGEPKIAAEKIKNFKTEGIIPIFCGSSEEIKEIFDYAKQNNHLLLSGLSTAPSLAEKNSNLFRFCMNDSKQAKALLRFAQETDTKSIILVYRDDVYGNDLKTNIMNFNNKMGIDIDQEVKYSPNETNFSSIMSSIEQKVKQEKSENPNSKVAVLLISMNEVSDIFKSAAGNSVLESVRWIGSDGVDTNAIIFKGTDNLEFTQKTNFTVCNFGIDINGIKEPYTDVPAKLKEKIGTDKIPTEAYYYYDAMWVLAESWLNIAEINHDLLKKNIPFKADTISVCTEEIGLDEFGDRKWGAYDFWCIKNDKFEKSANVIFGDWAIDGELTWYERNVK